MMAPTYASGFSSSGFDESDMMHRDYYPVITSIKHIPRKGPQIHAPNDVLEIRRAMIFRNFLNTFPYPEEVIRIDRSKMRRQPHDVVMETYIDFGFKKEVSRLYANGFLLKRQLLNPDAHKAFEISDSMNILRDIYFYKGIKECQYLSRMLLHGGQKSRKVDMATLSNQKLADLADLI